MARSNDASATRHAILGQLALRAWSAYELTKSMRRTLTWFWPRAESVIYAEARKLVDEGLATAREEPAADGSSRARTVYRITARGRKVLADWLASQPETLHFAIEPLLRIHLARFGTVEDLARAIRWTGARSEELLDIAEDVAGEFAAGDHVFQDDAHFRALLFSALWSLGITLRDWAHASLDEIYRWRSIEGSDEARARGVEAMQRAVRKRGTRGAWKTADEA